MYFEDNSYSIGRTPLVRLNRVTDGVKATVLAKIEARNPAYSVKCRIGASMVWDAVKRGVLTTAKELVEPTSGNTGIALAMIARRKGYRRAPLANWCFWDHPIRTGRQSAAATVTRRSAADGLRRT